MTIAKRVRDCRYAKGWGPDELAIRAEISRTALYQIECGKTGTPRAATLRRIARALDVSIETLLGDEERRAPEARLPGQPDIEPAGDGASASGRETFVRSYSAAAEGNSDADTLRVAVRDSVPARRSLTPREEGEIQRKFRELLNSPLGEGLARIVEETHRLLPEYNSR